MQRPHATHTKPARREAARKGAHRALSTPSQGVPALPGTQAGPRFDTLAIGYPSSQEVSWSGLSGCCPGCLPLPAPIPSLLLLLLPAHRTVGSRGGCISLINLGVFY